MKTYLRKPAHSSFTLTLSKVFEAERRIRPHIRETPLLESELLNQRAGFRLLVKAENLQVTGAFKARGAFNNILQLTPEEKRRGVVAISSGNHAQAVAYAARKFGVPATILMPPGVPKLKLRNTRGYGAEIFLRERAEGEQMMQELSKERGMRIVHPFNDLRTIAGQGTIGLEIRRQAEAMGITPDALIVNCSGGGLSSGIALTQDLYRKPPAFFVAEPQDFNDAQQSLARGSMVVQERRGNSICDALLMPQLGKLNLPILLRTGARGLTASDKNVQAAMAVAADYFNLVLEPGGAVAIACALLEREKFRGQTVVAVASGGNIDARCYGAMIGRGRAGIKNLLKPACG